MIMIDLLAAFEMKKDMRVSTLRGRRYTRKAWMLMGYDCTP